MAPRTGGHTTTLLPDGSLLVVGGYDERSEATASIQRFDPRRGTLASGSLPAARASHSAILLNNGHVLVFGGLNAAAEPVSTMLSCDPSTLACTTLGLVSCGSGATTTRLLDGRIFVVGEAGGGILNTTTGNIDGAPVTPRSGHTATLLADGRVLLTGGYGLASAEIYDPASGNVIATTQAMTVSRAEHAATLLRDGRVLITGGTANDVMATRRDTAEVFDPAGGGTFTALTATMAEPRAAHTSSLLPDGTVLIVGGGSADRFDPASETFSPDGALPSHDGHTATILPDGSVAIVGGATSADVLMYTTASPASSATGSMTAPRTGHSSTLLPSGDVLVCGGTADSPFRYHASAEVYESASGVFSAVGGMLHERSEHTATLLADGRGLIVGGRASTPITAAELFNPEVGVFTTAASMPHERAQHTATLLPSGKVLITGGTTNDGSTSFASALLYNPGTDVFTPTGAMSVARHAHTATSLPDGRVLIFGGSGAVAGGSAEIFDPAAGIFTTTSFPGTPLEFHSATLLSSGNVLIAGVETGGSSAAWLYTPASDSWSVADAPVSTRRGHTANLLMNGAVLLTGGSVSPGSASLYLMDAEPFATVTLMAAREGHAATALRNGKVLLTGGSSTGSVQATAELIDPGSFDDFGRPEISTISSGIVQPAQIQVTGTGFLGISEAGSGAWNQSATNVPILRLVRIDDDRTIYPGVSSWSPTSFESQPLNGLPAGHYRASIVVNGVPSIENIMFIEPANNAPLLSHIGDRSVAEGSSLTFTVVAEDEDGDPLVYSTTGMPAGATFDPDQREFSWTPAFTQANSYVVTFKVSDGRGGDVEETITIVVTNTPASPTTSTISSTTPIGSNGTFTSTITVAAKSPAGDTIPVGGDDVTLATTLGSLSGVTDNTDGTYTATLTSSTAGVASISGTINGTPMAATESVTIRGTTQTAISSTPNPSTANQSVTITATVTSQTFGTITGNVTFYANGNPIGTSALSSGTASLVTSSLPTGSQSLTAGYVGSATFESSTSSQLTQTVNLPPFGPPPGFSATASGNYAVDVSWTPVSGASTYEVYRAAAGVGFALIGSTANVGFSDSGLIADRTYLYKVRAIGNSGPSPFTAVEPATTTVFTDATLAGVVVKALHLTQLRTAVNAFRAAAGLDAFAFSAPTISPGMTIRAVDVVELRQALNAARSALALAPISYTDPSFTAQQTKIKGAHLLEIRAAIQ